MVVRADEREDGVIESHNFIPPMEGAVIHGAIRWDYASDHWEATISWRLDGWTGETG